MFKRLWRVIKSWLNFLIGKAEDPQKLLNQVVRDMDKQLREVKIQVSTAIADEKRLFHQAEKENQYSQDWEQKAMNAVNLGKDDLATEALVRKKEHDKSCAEYKNQWEKQHASCEALRINLKVLQQKIEESKRKKNVLIARSKRAEAQQNINETLDSMSDINSMGAFNEMVSKIEQVEAEAEAGAELNEEFSGDNLANKFSALEVSANTDNDLIALKQKMGMTTITPEKVRVDVDVDKDLELAAKELAIEEEIEEAFVKKSLN